jgi:dihydroorotase-like cyclic amidohydrolase
LLTGGRAEDGLEVVEHFLFPGGIDGEIHVKLNGFTRWGGWTDCHSGSAREDGL